jgi:hypothetical protein
MRALAVLAALLGCAGCSASFPTCIASGVPDAVGRWQYVGPLTERSPAAPAVAQTDRPRELELFADGRFTARFDPSGGSVAAAAAPRELYGRWQGGRFCAGAMFMPWGQIGTDPALPNVASIQFSGGQLFLLSAGRDHDDAAYSRAAPLP